METTQLDLTARTSESSTLLRWDGHMCNDVGATYGSIPLAFLSATPEELVLGGNLGLFRFPRGTVRRIGRGKLYPWFFGAVRIHHAVAAFPAALQFKPLRARPADVIASLRALGYPDR